MHNYVSIKDKFFLKIEELLPKKEDIHARGLNFIVSLSKSLYSQNVGKTRNRVRRTLGLPAS